MLLVEGKTKLEFSQRVEMVRDGCWCEGKLKDVIWGPLLAPSFCWTAQTMFAKHCLLCCSSHAGKSFDDGTLENVE